MLKNKITKFEKAFLNMTTKYRYLVLVFILLSLPLIYLVVLKTGGLKYSYSHLMYIPIVLAGFTVGKTWGIIAGIIGGLLLGPAMPLDPVTGENQLFFNWFIRLIVFTVVGFLSGAFSVILRRDLNKIVTLYSANPETMIPNTNSLESLPISDNNSSYLLVSIIINNYLSIVEMLGNDSYLNVFKKIYIRLKTNISKQEFIIQVGSNKLWFACEFQNLDEVMDQIVKLLRDPILENDIPLYIDYSIGSTIVKGQYKSRKISSFRQSDIAAHYASKLGKPYEVFRPEYLIKHNDYKLLGSFSGALAENQTFLVFQPKVNLQTNKPLGFEALIRWQHPTKGLLTPDKFIPSVEQTKLIHSLTEWVLHNVTQKILEFRKENINICISLNVSMKNLANPKFFESVINTLEKYNINPSQLELEITESMIMENPQESINNLKLFSKRGVETAIDDFGVGYSSLQYLARLPITTVKIDRYFISQMVKEESIKSIVEASVNMSHRLGYKVVAEGIEDSNSLDIAKQLQCDYGQGYYFGKPMTGDKIIEWYKEKSK